MTPLTIAALIAGLAAGAIQIAYLNHIRPFQADLGIQVAGALLVCWVSLSALAFARNGWKAKWVLLPIPIAMIGPALAALIFGACAFASACL